MKITATLTKNKGGLLIFESDGFPKLEENKRYRLNITQEKKDRSLDQNSLMWAIINQIAQATQNDETDIYIEGLERANVKSEFLQVIPEAEETLKRVFRIVKKVDEREINGKQVNMYKCHIGSSHFNTEEMGQLIDHFIQLAAECGIDIEER